MTSTAHYKAPGWLTKHVFNRTVSGITHLGISIRGSRVLAVRGRTSGEWRTVPVNLLTIGAERYLVAPRGETQWVRNIRVSTTGELHLGRQREVIHVVEIADHDKIEILREYLRRWKAEVGVFFDGHSHESSNAELAAISNRHPVFRLI